MSRTPVSIRTDERVVLLGDDRSLRVNCVDSDGTVYLHESRRRTRGIVAQLSAASLEWDERAGLWRQQEVKP